MKNKRIIAFFIIFFVSILFISAKSISTDFYAVNSFEGLRVRNKPSLQAEKIGLLKYQETVRCIKIEKESVTIDGIKSNWYKVKSTETNLEGYVFGGYLTPVKRVTGFIKNKSVNFNKNKILSLIDENSGIENNWKLDDGFYLPKKFIIQTPQLWHLNEIAQKRTACFGVLVKNGKLHYFELFDDFEPNIFSNAHELIRAYFQPVLDEKINKKDCFCVFESGRSGGGETFAIVFDGTNLNIVIRGNNCAFEEQISFILQKDSEEVSEEYDFEFPCFVNLTECDAYTSKKLENKGKISIKGNQRDVKEEMYGWGPLSIEGKQNIVELVDYFAVNGVSVFEGIYRGKTVYIKDEDLKAPGVRIYVNKESLIKSISFEVGL